MVPGQAPADRFGRPEKPKGGSESLGADIAREVLAQDLKKAFRSEAFRQALDQHFPGYVRPEGL